MQLLLNGGGDDEGDYGGKQVSECISAMSN